MTKEEYQEFSLRHKGCGACFPLYEKLNRFEKMWFTVIQKDVVELEEKNEKLEKEIEISQRCWQEQKNISLDTNCKLHKAKELLKWALHSDPEHDEDFDQKWEEAEQFLKENKYE